MTISLWWSDKLKADSEHFRYFVQHMANRFLVGDARYGSPKAEKMYLSRLRLELRSYSKTGNAEHLFNIANYALLEAVAPQNKRFHFNPLAASATRSKIGG